MLRLWPIGHGAPTPDLVPDTHVVRNALHMLGDEDLVPPANAHSSYPYLLPYLLLPVYAADFLWGSLQGEERRRRVWPLPEGVPLARAPARAGPAGLDRGQRAPSS